MGRQMKPYFEVRIAQLRYRITLAGLIKLLITEIIIIKYEYVIVRAKSPTGPLFPCARDQLKTGHFQGQRTSFSLN